PQFPLNYESKPSYIENYNSYLYDSSSFPQQELCCENCGVTHEAYKCQPMNEDYYHEQNSCYDSNSIGFDQSQPQQYTVNHPIFNAHNDLLKQEEKRIEEEQAAKAQNSKIPVCYDDDDDEERSNSLKDKIISGLPPCFSITLNEPVDSLIMGDEHLDTVPAMKSDEFIKSSVENLVPNPNVLEKIFLNPLFDEEIISTKIDPHHFNAESDLIESLLNHDSSIIYSSLKIDSLLDEFAGELTLLKSIPPGIDETDCDLENEIHLIERLLYDNPSPRPSKEFVSENSNAEIESFSPYPIPVKDSDSFMKEIDLSFNPDDPMPQGIEEDDYDSEREILILKDLPSNYSLSLPIIESYHFDIPSFSHPPAKPPDGNTGILNIKMMGDNSKQKVRIPKLMITLVSNQEKSPDLLPHRGLEIFQLPTKCPMMIHGKNIPILDIPLFHFYPLDLLKYGGIGSSSAT
nr:hypothetical protein [Tanacetum cinerariifolium]